MNSEKIVERFKTDIKKLGKDTLYVVIEIEPYSKSNFLKFARGKTYQPEEMKEKDRLVAAECARFMGKYDMKKINKPVFMQIDGYFSTRRVFDAPNLSKSICDALNDVVYFDDRQIVSCVTTKWYDKENPRVEIFIKVYDEEHDMVNVKTLEAKELGEADSIKKATKKKSTTKKKKITPVKKRKVVRKKK